jgi:hypothetical protein
MITQIENEITTETITYLTAHSHSLFDHIKHLIKYRKRLRSIGQCIRSTSRKYYHVYSDINDTPGRRINNRIEHLVKLKLAHYMDELINSRT